ncbi:MAG: Dam family site-specific DNA-(adenine-N6)-methyltransferase [Gammaproteobacteria bacterium]|nr:Dam family site-specific DNA-(adenine-N6)-methyltransferase [Gammaproteobacteria bacterium]MBP9729332.1 Dam family site-specific DNA-(adenine-N6)-methyltransferase [Gammaproteobacteria bacterium]
MQNKRIRSFLKWPGGKYRLMPRILECLPEGAQLIEPFVGGGSVFLNSHFKCYLLNDANKDLITLYKTLQVEGEAFIKVCKGFFQAKYNTEKNYYKLREAFNKSVEPVERSALFVYLNRHGYNGLCRYNAGQGAFNVPFGRYLKPYFPEEELYFFHEKSKKARFTCEDFSKTLQKAKQGSVVYADPPYVPLNNTAYFTAYCQGGFDLAAQKTLAELAMKLSDRGIPVLLSNHSTDFTKALYKDARIETFLVPRFISCKAALRSPVLELLALYACHNND